MSYTLTETQLNKMTIVLQNGIDVAKSDEHPLMIKGYTRQTLIEVYDTLMEIKNNAQ